MIFGEEKEMEQTLGSCQAVREYSSIVENRSRRVSIGHRSGAQFFK